MKFPYTISNTHGETLTFVSIQTNEAGEKRLIVENELTPNAGPPMHVHFKQDECLIVSEGKMGYKTLGGEEMYAKVGEEVIFKAGTPHKFWNAGDGILRCKGWVSPPNTLVYFLSEIYKSTNENKGRPGLFDSAYLLDRYKKEYDMYDIPSFVKNVLFPIALFFGKLTGKHKKFKSAPKPI